MSDSSTLWSSWRPASPMSPVPASSSEPEPTQAASPGLENRQTLLPEPKQTQSYSSHSYIKISKKSTAPVRDHTIDQLGSEGDEYLPSKVDPSDENKITPYGELRNGREYRCRTFRVPGRGEKLFMLGTECARVLGYRDSYQLFNRKRSLYKIIASQHEKDYLIQRGILPYSSQIAIITAK